MNARYRELYLSHICDLLGGHRHADIIARAHRVIALWRNTPHMAPFYVHRWTEILAMPIETARGIVLEQTPEGEMLRHCMPFAGVLDNSQKAMLRRAAMA